MSSPESTFLHRARLAANQILASIGLEVVRCPRSTERPADFIPLQIGNFQLQIQRGNSLWREYQKNPEYTAQLGRLAELVFAAHPDGYVIDVGANVGDTAAMVRSVCEAEIVCVEGDAAIFAQLKKNIANMGNISAHQCFLGEQTEVVQVLTNKDGWDATLIPVGPDGAVASREVKLSSLDDFVGQLAPQKPCKLLKLDIEGFDLRALRGAPGLLRRDRPVVLFEFNHENLAALGEDGLQIFGYLTSLGYDRLVIHDAQGFLMFTSPTADAELLSDLDEYARSVDGLFYFDFCAFHSSDAELAQRFLTKERSHRKQVIANKRGYTLAPIA